MSVNFNTFERGFPYKEITECNILETEFENGVVQKRKKWSQARKRFQLTFNVNTLTEITEIKDYFIARDGSYDTFTFTEPLSSTAYTVRFKENSFELTRDNYGSYSATVELIEEIS